MRIFAQKQDAPRKPLSSTLTRPARTIPGLAPHEHPILYLQHTIGNQAVQRLLQANQAAGLIAPDGSHIAIQRKDANSEEREKWQQALKGKKLPTGRRLVEEKTTAFYVEGLIETSKLLEPFIQGKLARTSVAKNFHIYGSREEFDAQAGKLVGEKNSPGTKFGGFYHRPTDSIHLPPRAAFGHALHEGIHKYSAAVVLGALGQSLNEGITQYFTDRVQAEHQLEGEAQNEYGEQLECAKIVLSWLPDQEKTMAEAYFQGKATVMAEAINKQLGIDAGQRSKLVGEDKLCERIKQKGPAT
jgi:hypothetical protein